MPGNGSEEKEYPERPGEPECAHYMRHGNCKFGLNCKFHHPKGQNEKVFTFNFYFLFHIYINLSNLGNVRFDP